MDTFCKAKCFSYFFFQHLNIYLPFICFFDTNCVNKSSFKLVSLELIVALIALADKLSFNLDNKVNLYYIRCCFVFCLFC